MNKVTHFRVICFCRSVSTISLISRISRSPNSAYSGSCCAWVILIQALVRPDVDGREHGIDLFRATCQAIPTVTNPARPRMIGNKSVRAQYFGKSRQAFDLEKRMVIESMPEKERLPVETGPEPFRVDIQKASCA